MKRIKLKIKLASPEEIQQWASGEITETETLNYRTLKPVTGGLFCAKTFGPVNDFECLCRKYVGPRNAGIRCEKCGVLVVSADSRRVNTGFIKLPVYVMHPWFFRTTNNKVAMLLEIPVKELKSLVNMETYFVFEPGQTKYKYGDIIKSLEYDQISLVEGFVAETGAKAIHDLLQKLDLKKKIKELQEKFDVANSDLFKKKFREKIQLCEDMLKNGINPAWMVISILCVPPPDLRPLAYVNDKIVSSDLNALYRWIIYRKGRLESLKRGKVMIPLIYTSEIRLLQESVNRLFGAGSETEKNKEENYKSLEDRIKGKEGHLRKAMLGKRVDFSARAVIVVNSDLKLDECYIPQQMALELFKPLILGYLRLYGFSSSLKHAKRLIEEGKPEVWAVVRDIIKTRSPVVLLNRAPTLHRLGLMAFKVKIWSYNAIGVNPLVCPSFNADFDGDQMAVHLPLSEEAKAEAMCLMMPSKNLGSPTHGNIVVGAFRDIAAGLYILTLDLKKETEKYFMSVSEIQFLESERMIGINDRISFYVDPESTFLEFKGKNGRFVKTTIGRVIFWAYVKYLKFEDCDQVVTSKHVQKFLQQVREIGDHVVAEMIDLIKEIGFKYANAHGVSVGKNDFFNVPGAKDQIEHGLEKQKELSKLLHQEFITLQEMKNKSLTLWRNVSATVRNMVSKIIKEQPDNPIVAMMESGARGSVTHLVQVLCFKGNSTSMTGEISPIPIYRGHWEGLEAKDIIQAKPALNKVCASTAIMTADAGYLTRRLVDVNHACFVSEIDCKCEEYLTMGNLFNEGSLLLTVYDRILHRTLATDVEDGGKVIVQKGTLIGKEVLEILKERNITKINVRSPVTCKCKDGICVACYGGDLSTGKFVNLGEAVGVIAAQSIGEPGTQLTMSSFHYGGVAKFGTIEKTVVTPFSGKITFNKKLNLVNRGEHSIVISRNLRIIVNNMKGFSVAEFDVPYGAKLYVKEGQEVVEEGLLASWGSEQPIIAEFDGVCEFYNLYEGTNYEVIIDEVTGKKKKIVIKSKLFPTVSLKGTGREENYFLPENTILEVENGEVKVGDIIALTRFEIESVDIKGGLDDVENILENRILSKGVLAPTSGAVTITTDKRGQHGILIGEKVKIPVGNATPIVQNGQFVEKGDALTDGKPSLQAVLDTRGIQALWDHFNEMLVVIYSAQGLHINGKHFEVLLRQMCRKVEILEGPNWFAVHDRSEFQSEKYATRVLVQGITEAALSSPSFVSGASFQETIKVLVDAALRGKVDPLKGLKENMILGEILPVGTGFAQRFFEEQAKKLEKE